MSRSLTLLIISGTALIRADVSTATGLAPQVTGLQRGERPPTDDPETILDACLAMGEERPGVLWVLLAEGGMAVLDLPRTALERLPPEALTQRLALDVEPLTGLAVIDTRLGWRELPATGVTRRFWCVQVPHTWWTAADDLFTRRNLRFGGMLHPAGLAGPMTGEQPPWSRLEAWGAMVIEIAQDATFATSVTLPGIALEDAWRGARGDLTAVIGPGHGDVVAVDMSRGGHPIPVDRLRRLDDMTHLGQWCVAAAQTLNGIAARTPPTIPVILAPPKPWSPSLLMAVAVLTWALTASACWAHWRWSAQVTSVTGVNDPAKELKTVEDAIAVIQATDAKVVAADNERRQRRVRAAAVLRAVSDTASDDLLVTTLRVTTDGLELRGGTVRSEAPNHFAERLDHLLQPLGWRASVREVASSGSGWTFTLVASDPAVLKAPATTGGKKSAGPATLPANAASGVKR